MARRQRRNHGAEFKARVALVAIRGDKTLSELAEQRPEARAVGDAPGRAGGDFPRRGVLRAAADLESGSLSCRGHF
jgi:hypothetical protein